jgi:hypothetical protein
VEIGAIAAVAAVIAATATAVDRAALRAATGAARDDNTPMSVAVEVIFPSAKMPSPEVWQDSIRANGFPLELDCTFDPRTFTGFLPASYRSSPGGFEYLHAVETDGASRSSFVWQGNPTEAISGIIAAACLAELTGGDLVDTDSGETIPAVSVIEWARKSEAELRAVMNAVQERSSAPTRAHGRPWWKFW